MDDVDIVKDKNGKEYLVNRVDGIKEIAFIDYLTFKNLGGEIYKIPKWATCNIAPFFGNDFHKFDEWVIASHKLEWNSKDFEIEATFDNLFPHLQNNSPLVYIDNEAYDILTVDV